MKKISKLLALVLSLVMIVLSVSACAKDSGSADSDNQPASFDGDRQIEYRYASKEEGAELMLSNDAYYDNFTQNDLDFKMHKKGATMDEYKAFAKEQVLDFTDEQKAWMDDQLTDMEQTLADNGYTLPPLDEIVFISTTMKEEDGAAGYTHGTQIYLGGDIIDKAVKGNKRINAAMKEILWHEMFHCLTRCNPDFRAEAYKLVHFTVTGKDYTLPPSVEEYHITNPDVEHHDSYATFRINGQDVDCFTDFVTTKHFEKEGETFFDSGTTALIPTDGSDTYYTPEQAENFNEIFGTNTDYVIDPEECMADNFSYAMCYGTAGPGGKGYPNPEIIEGVLKLISK